MNDRVINFPPDDLTDRLNKPESISKIKKEYCINYAGCRDRGLNIFCIKKGIITALMCKECNEMMKGAK